MEMMEDYQFADDPLLYKKAKAKARKIRGFYISAALYCIVIPILIFINLRYSPDFYWFFFSLIGWGIGLLFHGAEAFEWNVFWGKKWEERKIKELLEKQNSNSQINNDKTK